MLFVVLCGRFKLVVFEGSKVLSQSVLPFV